MRRSWALMGMTELCMQVAVLAPASAVASKERITITGEIVDTWCSASQIMGYALGSAHYQCAVWCAVGGIPVSVRADEGRHFMVLKIGDETQSVASPRLIDIQAHQVTVEGDVYSRDGVSYLLIDQVKTDGGIVNLSHKDYGILPFGE